LAFARRPFAGRNDPGLARLAMVAKTRKRGMNAILILRLLCLFAATELPIIQPEDRTEVR
jgi:hypothetical protein